MSFCTILTFCTYFKKKKSVLLYFEKILSALAIASFIFCVCAGFGDAVNNSQCWLPVTKYIEDQFDKFLEAEQRVHRYVYKEDQFDQFLESEQRVHR